MGKSLYTIVCLLLAAGCASEPGVRPGDLRCENLHAPLAVDNTQPRFSWKIHADGAFSQSAYEILVASDSLLLEAPEGHAAEGTVQGFAVFRREVTHDGNT